MVVGMGSVHHTLSLLLLPPEGLDSSHCPCSSLGPSQGRVLQELLQCGFLYQWAQSFRNCPSVDPFSHGVSSPPNKPGPGVLLSPQFLPVPCSSRGFPGAQSPRPGLLLGLQGDLCSPWMSLAAVQQAAVGSLGHGKASSSSHRNHPWYPNLALQTHAYFSVLTTSVGP